MTAMRVVATALAAFVLVGATACGSESGAEPADAGGGDVGYEAQALAEDEWLAREGDAWHEFDEGYLAGWESGCDVAFEGSPDGYLYDQGDQFSADDCYALAPFDASDADVPLDIPFDPYSEGEALGESDGCVAAFEELPSYGVLNWGEDSYDASVCP